jgi:hypothetical protein
LTSTTSQGSATAMAFTDTLTTNVNQSNSNNIFMASVTATNLNITTSDGCLGNDATQTAGYQMDTTSNTFVLTISGPGNNTNNVLALQGTLANNVISGTWTMYPAAPPASGTSSCNGSGTFTMKLASGSSFPVRHG